VLCSQPVRSFFGRALDGPLTSLESSESCQKCDDFDGRLCCQPVWGTFLDSLSPRRDCEEEEGGSSSPVVSSSPLTLEDAAATATGGRSKRGVRAEAVDASKLRWRLSARTETKAKADNAARAPLARSIQKKIVMMRGGFVDDGEAGRDGKLMAVPVKKDRCSRIFGCVSWSQQERLDRG